MEGATTEEKHSYWKIGSRWDGDGSAARKIFDVFQRNNMVFIDRGDNQGERFDDEVKVGDIMAIADGLTVVAVARVCSVPFPVKAESIVLVGETAQRYLPYHLKAKDVIGVKVCMTVLQAADRFPCTQGKFFQVHHEPMKEQMDRFVPNEPVGWLDMV